MLDLMLCSDHDFSFFREVRFNSSHEIQIDVQTGEIIFNTADNWRHYLRNLVSLGVFFATSVYVGYVYNEF